MTSSAAEFSKHPQNRDELRKVLDTPIFKEALAILKEEMIPIAGSSTEGNPVVGAARYQQLAGANQIIRGLELLTQTPVERKPIRVKRLTEELSPTE